MILTKSGGLIMGPLASFFGMLLDWIYILLDSLNIANIGLAIMIFTILTRLLMYPLTFKQTKSTKIMNIIQPEISKVTKKYRGKKDQESLLAQQRETKEIQQKYGISMSTGCITSFLQLPIFLALYKVIQNIPAYVGKVYDLYSPIANSIAKSNGQEIVNEIAKSNANIKLVATDNTNTIIDILAKFTTEQWSLLTDKFASNELVSSAISDYSPHISNINHFFGINMTETPGFALALPIIVPVLSMVFQFLSMAVMPTQQSSDPSQQSAQSMMKIMSKVMPIFSFFICLNVPVGLGIYWAAGAFISFITTVLVNYYFSKCDMDYLLEKCKKNAEKKNEKRKKSGKKSFMERMMEASATQQANTDGNATRMSSTSLKNYNASSNNNSNVNYKQGSLASKANIMSNYNDKIKGGGK